MTVKHNLKLTLPSIALHALRSIKDRIRPPDNCLTYAPSGWNTPLPPDAGQDCYFPKPIENEGREWEPLAAGSKRTPRQRVDDQNLHMTFGYVLALAARNKQALRLLDYGGNLGYYYRIATVLFPGVAMDYHCKELPALADEGRRLNPEIKWHTDDSCLDEKFDAVIFSGVLPYIQDWQSLLRRASASTRQYLYIALHPTVETAPSYVAIQKFRGASMLYQSFNRDELTQFVRATGLCLVREFWFGEHLAIRDAPEQPSYRGWLFEKHAGV